MPQDHISQKRAVYRIAGMERAIVRKDVWYRTTNAGPLTMDLYYPADAVADARGRLWSSLPARTTSATRRCSA